MALCRIPFLVSAGFYSVVCFSSCCLWQMQKAFFALQNLSFYNAQCRVGGVDHCVFGTIEAIDSFRNSSFSRNPRSSIRELQKQPCFCKDNSKEKLQFRFGIAKA
ncbi:hypothetical protein [Prevotella intermedia]|nr:hypothetical protein [Prevotella intermedia]